jgi:hypothetical protein
MKPKEKAEELIDFFTAYKSTKYTGFTLPMPIPKSFALRTVNEIIYANPHSNPFNTDVHSTMDYWLEVRKEIEKL